MSRTGLHAAAVEELTAYRPGDPDQVRLRESCLDHLTRRPDGCSIGCTPAHVTASAAVLDVDGRRVLLHLHRKAGLWLQFGGHCEPGDRTLAGAALREAREESGIAGLRVLPGPVQLDRHPAPCGPRVDWHLDVEYAAVAPSDAVERISAESAALGWFDVAELPEPTDAAVRGLVAGAVRRLRGH